MRLIYRATPTFQENRESLILTGKTDFSADALHTRLHQIKFLAKDC